MSTKKKLLEAAAGNAGGAVYVDDVFSTYLYEGNNTNPRSITNNIDLANEGGMVWIKRRTATDWHVLSDTERGTNSRLNSNSSNAAGLGVVTAFNSDGFNVNDSGQVNFSGDYVSWTFRKQPGFFDVVTYTGDTSTSKQIAHNLGSTPACIIIKRTDEVTNWVVYHKDIPGSNGTGVGYLSLNTIDNDLVNANAFPTQPTDTHFTVNANYGNMNASGGTYVAYLFAHDAQEFGTDSDESIIKCGAFTGNATVDLGFEPQWVMIRRTNNIGNWFIQDSMRGIATEGIDATLFANLSDPDNTNSDRIDLTSTGFIAKYGTGIDSWIYVAIRRPMKPPESGTEVFSTVARTATGATYTYSGNDFPVDMVMQRQRSVSNTVDQANIFDRLRGATKYLSTAQTQAEQTNSGITGFDYQDGYVAAFGSWSAMNWTNGSTEVYWNFKRAPGFFDVVAYTGNSSNRTINHNLGVAPELMIVKSRSNGFAWQVYSSALGATKRLLLNLSTGEVAHNDCWNTTDPTESVFSLGIQGDVNFNNSTFVAYLFASSPGISKVGSYTGNGTTTNNIDCGFSSGARFVVVKRTDSTGNWYVWDTERGIVAGNDPKLYFNLTGSEITGADEIDPYSAGFTISTSSTALNASGGSYIFLAIA